MTSELRVDRVSDETGEGPVALTAQAAAKAFINLDTFTHTIRDSLNVSSTTDHATGDFSIAFTNPFADADHTMVTSGNREDDGNHVPMLGGWYPPTASTVRLCSEEPTGPTFVDFKRAMAAFFGELA